MLLLVNVKKITFLYVIGERQLILLSNALRTVNTKVAHLLALELALNHMQQIRKRVAFDSECFHGISPILLFAAVLCQTLKTVCVTLALLRTEKIASNYQNVVVLLAILDMFQKVSQHLNYIAD